MEIRLDDLLGKEIATFIDDHVAEMKKATPPESKHALDIEELRKPDIRFWTVWDGDSLVGCGALKQMGTCQAEIKAMRTHASFRGKGIASTLLQHILNDAKASGIREVFLETGAMPFFEPARKLYLRNGFTICGPFGAYVEDPNSVFMSMRL